MRVISIKDIPRGKEIEIENSFLFFKWREKYRKFDQTIFKYKEPDNYYEVGWYTKIKINDLFEIKIIDVNI
jgi:hypothetical protein